MIHLERRISGSLFHEQFRSSQFYEADGMR